MADYYNYALVGTPAQSPAAFYPRGFQSPTMLAYEGHLNQAPQTSSPFWGNAASFQVPMSPVMGAPLHQPWMMSPQYPYHNHDNGVHAMPSRQQKRPSPSSNDSGLGASLVSTPQASINSSSGSVQVTPASSERTPVYGPSRAKVHILSTPPAFNLDMSPPSTKQPVPAVKMPVMQTTPFTDIIELVKSASAITPEPSQQSTVTPPERRIIKKAKRRCPTKIVDNKIVAKNKPLDPLAVNVMNTWYIQHIEHPYPTDEEKEQLALDANISIVQVKAWFSNKRNRSHNTKPRNEKRKLEDQIVQMCNELMQPENRQNTSIDTVVQKLLSLVESNRD